METPLNSKVHELKCDDLVHGRIHFCRILKVNEPGIFAF